MSPPLRRSLLGLALALVGCLAAHAPLGEDWEALGPAEQDQRALEALEDLFRGEGAGAALDDREVEAVDLEGVTYRTPLGESRLRWQDVESVQGQTHEEIPSRPETLRLYLRNDSPSVETVLDEQAPLLASVGLARPYLFLHRRPRWSRVRLLAALDHVRARREQQLLASLGGVAPVDSTRAPASGPAATTSPEPAAAVAAVDSETPPTATPEALDALEGVEAKLRKLKEWHDAGLISPEEYAEKRRELLSGM